MNKIFLFGMAALVWSALPAAAQYDQDINVEGKYVPEYINHDRIGLFPKPVRFDTQQSELSYYLKGVNAQFEPQLVPLQATGWRTSRTYSHHRGYLDLGLGSWLDATLSAGYRFVDTDDTLFGVRLQHNSTSLWKPKLSSASEDVKRSRYDEMIGLYASHVFDSTGRLDAAVDYHVGYFNYYGFDLPQVISDASNLMTASPALKAPTQTLNDVAARVDWHSPASRDEFSWFAGAGVRYFGYRSCYDYEWNSVSMLSSVPGSRETATSLQAGFVLPTSGKSAIGLDFEGNLVTYADRSRTVGGTEYAAATPDNYGILYLTPYYRFNRSGIDIRLGAQIDLAFNAGAEHDRYSTFHIAPSVKFDYNAGPAALYLYAKGGSRLNTLAARYEWDYYQCPEILSSKPIYSPVDATFGVTFGPFSGFHAGLNIAYRVSRGQYVGGWYMGRLNGGEVFPSNIGLPSNEAGRAVSYVLDSDLRYDLSGLSFGLDMGYDAGRYFKIDGSARYQRQNGKTGYFNGFDRPEWTVDVTAETNPWNSLKFRVGYSLRAMRMMTLPSYWSDTTILNGLTYGNYRLPNKSLLNFGVSYGITDNFDVWIQADNLLNRKTLYMPCLPAPGLTIAAGLGLRF